MDGHNEQTHEHLRESNQCMKEETEHFKGCLQEGCNYTVFLYEVTSVYAKPSNLID